MTTVDTIRAAIIGSGGMGHTRATHLSQTDDASIVCVSSRNSITGPTLAQRFEADFIPDWRDAVERPDVNTVFVTTHNDSHAAIALAAVRAGKHVLVEYPLATTVDDADLLIEESDRRRLVLHVGHDQAMTGWHLGIKQAAEQLGSLRAVNGVLATPTRGGGRSVWRNRNLSGPPFMVGISYVYHLLDLFGPVEWVEGTCSYDDLDDAGYYRASVCTMTARFRACGVAQILYIRGFTVPRDEQEQAMMFDNGFLSYRGYVSGSRTNAGQLTQVTSTGVSQIPFPQVTLAMASRQNTDRFVARLRGAPPDGSLSLAREAVAVARAVEEAAGEEHRVYLKGAPVPV